MSFLKVLQKQTYTFLSHQYGVLLIFAGIVLVIVSAFQFGEITMEWSRDKYSALFNIYHDNIAGKAFQDRMCLPMPMDVVYTWVNGSDPKLLADMQAVKDKLDAASNVTKAGAKSNSSTSPCHLENCISFNFAIIDAPLPKNVTLDSLKDIPAFQNAEDVFQLTKEGETKVIVIQLGTPEDVDKMVRANPVIQLGQTNATLSRSYLSSDTSHHKRIELDNKILVKGIAKDTTVENIKDLLSTEKKEYLSNIEIRQAAGIAVISISKTEELDNIITEADKAEVEGDLKFLKVFLVWGLEAAFDDDMSANRFEDNEELRYSLRSLEKHAPWIRNVYIVTNGQIPSWLNLDNPRLTIVSHSELFLNKSHLPTFSSPAIESNIHRIPGLSQRFIYLNDDTMFGKDVWPDDFYSHAGGQKVYLSWPVPNCAEGCPSTWIKDNYCDKACNTSECEWDGGDCEGVSAPGPAAGAGKGDSLNTLYCSSGCANGWVADKYCDTACNNPDCGYDAGDCGAGNFHLVYSIKVTEPAQFTLPKGLQVAFFNVTSIFGKNGTITDGHYKPNDMIRTSTVAQLFKTVHLLLHANMSERTLSFRVTGKKPDGTQTQIVFNVTADTRPVLERALIVKPDAGNASNEIRVVNATEAPFPFDDISEELRHPRHHIGEVPRDDVLPVPPEIAAELMTDEVKAQIKIIDGQFQDGEITDKGYRLMKNNILVEYLQSDRFEKMRRKLEQEKRKRNAEETVDKGQERLRWQQNQNDGLLVNQQGQGLNQQDMFVNEAGIQQGLLVNQNGAQEGVPPNQGGQLYQQDIPVYQQNLPLNPQGVQFNEQGILANQLGIPLNQQDIPVNQQDIPVNQQGVPVNQQGIPVNQQGIPVNQQGIPVNQQGIPVNQQGIPVNQQGLPVNQQGIPVNQQGIPVNQQGILVNQQGIPVNQQGIPVNPQGIHINQQGIPVNQQGIPVNQQGIPVNQQGIPVNQQGIPVNQQGIPVNQQGLPFNQQGLPINQQVQVSVPVYQQGIPQVPVADAQLNLQGQQAPQHVVIPRQDNPVPQFVQVPVQNQQAVPNGQHFQGHQFQNDALGIPQNIPERLDGGQKIEFLDKNVLQGQQGLGHVVDPPQLALDQRGTFQGQQQFIGQQQFLQGQEGAKDLQDGIPGVLEDAVEMQEGHEEGNRPLKRNKSIKLTKEQEEMLAKRRADKHEAFRVQLEQELQVAEEQRKAKKFGENVGQVEPKESLPKEVPKGWNPKKFLDENDLADERNGEMEVVGNGLEKKEEGKGEQEGVDEQLHQNNWFGVNQDEDYPVALADAVEIDNNQDGPIDDQGKQQGLSDGGKMDEIPNLILKQLDEVKQDREVDVKKDVQGGEDNLPNDGVLEAPEENRGGKDIANEQKSAEAQGNDLNALPGLRHMGREQHYSDLEGAGKVPEDNREKEFMETDLEKKGEEENVAGENKNVDDENTFGKVEIMNEEGGVAREGDKHDDQEKIQMDQDQVLAPPDAKRRKLLSVNDLKKDILQSWDTDRDYRSLIDDRGFNGYDANAKESRLIMSKKALAVPMRIVENYGMLKSKQQFLENLEVSDVSKRGDALFGELDEETLRRNEKYSRINSFLPWERTDLFVNITQDQPVQSDDYNTLRHKSRHLLDTFGDSLRHVNKLYNKRFGFVSRKVPAHMPHMIDVNIMNQLQAEYEEEFNVTASHQFRHSKDMQYSFSYMYYMMSSPKEVNVSEVFDEFDTDGSGVLSDREIRTLATRLYDLPLDLQTLNSLENIIINCSKYVPVESVKMDATITEEYYVKTMPQVTKSLILQCGPLIKKLEGSVEGQTKYKFEIIGEEEIAFKMIRTNVSHVIGQLDDVRKHPKKFVCLNDNIHHNEDGASIVKAVLQDFYESLLPTPSQFELPREYRNRFLHIDELREWRHYRDWLRFWTHISLGALVMFTVATFCSSQLVSCKRRCCGRRRLFPMSEGVFHV